MKDYAKIIYDNKEWYGTSADYFLKTYPPLVHQYLLLDFTTLYDRDSFYEIIKESLGIQLLDIIERPNSITDNEHIVLYNDSSFEFIDMTTPILYFAGTFVALFHNKLWFKLRDIQYDLVVDRHGNILPLSLIAEGKC